MKFHKYVICGACIVHAPVSFINCNAAHHRGGQPAYLYKGLAFYSVIYKAVPKDTSTKLHRHQLSCIYI